VCRVLGGCVCGGVSLCGCVGVCMLPYVLRVFGGVGGLLVGHVCWGVCVCLFVWVLVCVCHGVV
jgi:hypothetical protein